MDKDGEARCSRIGAPQDSLFLGLSKILLITNVTDGRAVVAAP
jgi:hypothetical protein